MLRNLDESLCSDIIILCGVSVHELVLVLTREFAILIRRGWVLQLSVNEGTSKDPT